MARGYAIRRNQYFDSVFLMQVAQRLSEEPGIEEVAALTATEKNKGLLADIGFEDAEIRSAGPNDLVIALIGGSESRVREILADVDGWLVREPSGISKAASSTLDEALAVRPQANLAVISVPGEYAAHEAREALEHGLNTFLFSSNVSVEDELSLKQFAREHGQILMGPDCGTAIINGAGIGFANVVRRGSIGVIGSTGTGLQEFTTLVHRSGAGISHAIGTGSRDLSDEIGGISTLSALEALEADPQTKIIVVLSKPPGEKTLSMLVDTLNRASKPMVTALLGVRDYPGGVELRFATERTIDAAAAHAAEMAIGESAIKAEVGTQALDEPLAREREGMAPEQKFIRGIFAGGTFCYQAQQVIGEAGLTVHSNAPLEGMLTLDDPAQSEEHTLVDMGAEVFTQSRPHPMIDPTLRRERIAAEAEDPQVAILLVDFILGYNASMDPVGDLLGPITEAKRAAGRRGGSLSVVASVCGTERDPQDLRQQTSALEEAGVVVLRSSAQAALFSQKMALTLEA